MENQQREIQTAAAFKALCEMLDGLNWNYEKDEQKLTVKTGYKGEDIPMPLEFRLDEKNCLITLISGLPFAVPKEKNVTMAVAVSEANFGMVDGSFDYNFLDGSLLYRITSSYRDSVVSKSLFNYMLATAIATVERYNDKFFVVANSDMTVQSVYNYIQGVKENG